MSNTFAGKDCIKVLGQKSHDIIHEWIWIDGEKTKGKLIKSCAVCEKIFSTEKLTKKQAERRGWII